MTQNLFIIFFFALLVISLVTMVVRDIFGPAHILSNGKVEFDPHSPQTVVDDVAPMRVLTSCDVTMAYDIRDVDFGK